MKHTKFFIFALVAAMTFSACGTDDTRYPAVLLS